MIIKVITCIIGAALAVGFLWYAGRVIVAGIHALNSSSEEPAKKGARQ